MLERIRMAVTAGVEAWRGFESPETPETLQEQYAAFWAIYSGTMFGAAWRRQGVFRNYRVYRNTRLLWKHARAIGDFYGSKTYQGDLPTDGKRLPDGSPGAIPIDPQTGNPETNEQLTVAVAQTWNRWNWRQGMRIRPRYVSILGDGLTELVDDPARHAVWPQFVWPGYVVDLELDEVDNVKAYAVEYMVTIEKNGRQSTHRYRKEVDKEAFRYYLDDRPWTDRDGHGAAVQPNPYGFVPAIWDRFEHQPDTVRGLSALAGTRQALMELNSVLSHSVDYQRKAFGAPILIKGSMGPKRRDVIGPERTEDSSKLAESLGFKEVAADGGIEQVQFDIGKTLDQLAFVKQGILDENPEAKFYHELRQMSQLTGPAVRLAMGDTISRVEDARSGFDPQTVKLFQMNIAMCGYRLNAGDWEAPTPRDEVYRPFDLESYTAGKLDMGILSRDVIPVSEEERLEIIERKERIRYVDSLVALGMEQTEAEKLIAEREAQELRRVDVY